MTSGCSLRSSSSIERGLCINIHVKIVYSKFRPFVKEATTRPDPPPPPPDFGDESLRWGGRKEGGARFRFEGGHYPIRGRVARPPPWNMAFLHLAFECLSSSLVIFVKGGSLKRGEQKESATGTEAGAQKERRIIYSNEEPQLTKCPSFLNVGYLFSKSFESLSSFSR